MKAPDGFPPPTAEIVLDDSAAVKMAKARTSRERCVSLARRNAATLVTADRKPMRLCEHMGTDRVAEVPPAE